MPFGSAAPAAADIRRSAEMAFIFKQNALGIF
jgi:hypothetical protein